MSLERTLFYDDHVALGGRMVDFAGFELPVQFTGVNAEHECVRSAVGLFDVSHMGEVFLRGPRALAAAQWLVTNDISRLADGEALYTVMCNDDGGVVDDVVVYRLHAEEFLICVNAANRAKDHAFMVANNPHGAHIVDEGARWAQVAIQGPSAATLVGQLTHPDALKLKPFSALRTSFAGVEGCLVARTGYTGEDGFEVFVPVETGALLWRDTLQAGASLEAQPIGLGARDTLRLEAALHLYGHELTDQTTPWQAGLGWVVALDKGGGFVGRDALIARKGKADVRLAGLELDGKRIARDGMPVLLHGEPVGTITSGTRSPTLGRPIALAYLRSDLIKPGTQVTVDVRGRPAPATVCRRPFFKRSP